MFTSGKSHDGVLNVFLSGLDMAPLWHRRLVGVSNPGLYSVLTVPPAWLPARASGRLQHSGSRVAAFRSGTYLQAANRVELAGRNLPLVCNFIAAYRQRQQLAVVPCKGGENRTVRYSTQHGSLSRLPIYSVHV